MKHLSLPSDTLKLNKLNPATNNGGGVRRSAVATSANKAVTLGGQGCRRQSLLWSRSSQQQPSQKQKCLYYYNDDDEYQQPPTLSLVAIEIAAIDKYRELNSCSCSSRSRSRSWAFSDLNIAAYYNTHAAGEVYSLSLLPPPTNNLLKSEWEPPSEVLEKSVTVSVLTTPLLANLDKNSDIKSSTIHGDSNSSNINNNSNDDDGDDCGKGEDEDEDSSEDKGEDSGETSTAAAASTSNSSSILVLHLDNKVSLDDPEVVNKLVTRLKAFQARGG